jgi:hypothetical protein
MSRLSMKGVLIGAIVDVVTSFLLGVPLAGKLPSKRQSAGIRTSPRAHCQ